MIAIHTLKPSAFFVQCALDFPNPPTQCVKGTHFRCLCV